MTPVAMIRAGKWPSAEGQVCAPGATEQTAVGGLKSPQSLPVTPEP